MSVAVSSPYPTRRPPPHTLALLVRAALADDGRGGPWLSVIRTHTTAGAVLYTSHIHTYPVDQHSSRRLVLLSGTEALAYALREGWDSLTDPTVAQLHALQTYAVQLWDAPGWDACYPEWVSRLTSPQSQAAASEFAENCAADVRALRWREAERWLSRTV